MHWEREPPPLITVHCSSFQATAHIQFLGMPHCDAKICLAQSGTSFTRAHLPFPRKIHHVCCFVSRAAHARGKVSATTPWPIARLITDSSDWAAAWQAASQPWSPRRHTDSTQLIREAAKCLHRHTENYPALLIITVSECHSYGNYIHYYSGNWKLMRTIRGTDLAQCVSVM